MSRFIKRHLGGINIALLTLFSLAALNAIHVLTNYDWFISLDANWTRLGAATFFVVLFAVCGLAVNRNEPRAPGGIAAWCLPLLLLTAACARADQHYIRIVDGVSIDDRDGGLAAAEFTWESGGHSCILDERAIHDAISTGHAPRAIAAAFPLAVTAEKSAGDDVFAALTTWESTHRKPRGFDAKARRLAEVRQNIAIMYDRLKQ